MGGGISGLVAAYALSHYRATVRVLEPGRPGGDFAAGGLKYLNRTDAMASMLADIGCVYTNYTIQGGILLHGAVEPYPTCLKSMPRDRAARIQADHYRKTRRTEPDEFAARSMNDPEATAKARKALRTDHLQVIRALAGRASILPKRVDAIEPRSVATPEGERFAFDFLVVTIPLWIVKRIALFAVPDALAMKLNLVQVEPRHDPYAQWDYVYTPYTPEDLVHRISPREGGYSVEFNGSWADGDGVSDRLTSDLNFLFPDGWALHGVKRGLNGHLLPLDVQPAWPANTRPLGRFAQWDPRATTDVVLDSAFEMAEAWELKRIR